MERVLIALMYDLLNTIETFLNPLEPVLRNLDPSLFQNVIIGILAIFIPFAIVFFADILDSQKQRGEFEKMVLTEEVFEVKRLFLVSVLGTFSFSFFATNSDKALNLSGKVFATVLIVSLSVYLGRLFWKVLKFSEGDKDDFGVGFLKRLHLYANKDNEATKFKMIKAWKSFWSQDFRHYGSEGKFTDVFIIHIDRAIEIGDFNFAIQLADSYYGKRTYLRDNFRLRDNTCLNEKILPKIFEWIKLLSNKDSDDLVENPLYFQGMFVSVAETLFRSVVFSHDVFDYFEQHIKNKEETMEKIKDPSQRDDCEQYIRKFISNFLSMIFVNLEKDDFNLPLFPDKWTISSENSESRVVRLILHEFISLVRKDFVFSIQSLKNSSFTSLLNYLFPYVRGKHFSSFLSMFFARDIKTAIQEGEAFNMIPSMYTEESMYFEEDQDELGEEEIDQFILGQNREAIDVIYDYFSPYWIYLQQPSKLHNLLNELESSEIKEFCQQREIYEKRRERFVKLIRLLIEESSKRAISSK